MAEFSKAEKQRLYRLAGKAYLVDNDKSILTDPADHPFVVGTVESVLQVDDGGYLRIGIAGSQDGPDWLNNLKAYPATQIPAASTFYQPVKVHRKFWTEANRYVDALMRHPVFQPVLANEAKVWLSGHSRGGALAVYIARLLKHKDCVAGGMTFGAPRPYCSEHKNVWPLNFIHAVNTHDSVTDTPFKFFGAPWHWGKDTVDKRSIRRTGTEHPLAHYSPWVD